MAKFELVEAALDYRSHNGKVYFFGGEEYVRYDVNNDKVDFGYPKRTKDNWHGVPFNRIDAALDYRSKNGKVYFFSGDEYVRYDVNNDKVDSGYPKRTKDNWHGVPFNRIDAALDYRSKNGKVYFFSGDVYVRYDVNKDKVDPGYPKRTKDNWHGVSFNRIDAALDYISKNGKVYFFSGDEYVRYDVNKDKVDPGYPKRTKDNWHRMPSYPVIDPLKAKVKVSIHNINLLDKSSAEDVARRHRNIANMVLKGVKSDNMSWDLIALNECHAEREGRWNVNYKELPIPCLNTAIEILSTSCFSANLRNSDRLVDINYQKGEIGVIARSEKFINADGVIHIKSLGNKWYGTVHRRVVGARFRIRDSGYILPFYSTHISAVTADMNRKTQLEDLVAAIKEWWQPGDLTPIVVGDFNSNEFNSDHWDIMKNDFEEVGASFGHDKIEHIWIGKESTFRGAIGKMRAVQYKYLSEFADHGINLSDHPVSYVELLTPFTTITKRRWWKESLVNYSYKDMRIMGGTGIKSQMLGIDEKRRTILRAVTKNNWK